MNITSLVNNGQSEARVDIAACEAKFSGSYVGQFCLKDSSGNWVNSAADVFYQPNPRPEHSHYVAVFVQNGKVYVTKGDSAVDGIFNAVQADDGEIVYSRYRHDMRSSKDGTTWIDGGRDYVHMPKPAKELQFKIVDGQYIQEPT